MGFSGGLVPLVEGLVSGAYNVAGLVGLGAATLSLASTDMINAVLSLVDFAQSSIGKLLGWLTGGIETLLRSILGKLGLDILNVGHLANEFIDLVSRGSSLAIDKIREIIAVLPKIPPLNLPTLSGSGAQMFVNVYGTKDILCETGIGGYRESLFGFSVDDEDYPLFNIEVKGAEHLYYMKRNDLDDPEWNTTVSDFVTLLMLNSDSSEKILSFLNDPQSRYYGCIEKQGDKWIVKLSGWQLRDQ